MKRLINICVGKYGGEGLYLAIEEVNSVKATNSKIWNFILKLIQGGCRCLRLVTVRWHDSRG